jgi:hypothetical protein
MDDLPTPELIATAIIIDDDWSPTPPFVATPVAVQPEPIDPGDISIVDRTVEPDAAVIDGLVPGSITAIVGWIAPRGHVVVAVGIVVRAAIIALLVIARSDASHDQ